MIEHNYIDFGDAPPDAGEATLVLGDRYLRLVREFCTTWIRAVKTICLYPPSNPLPEEFRGKFFEALSVLLEEQERLVLTTFAEGFDCGGQTVYEAAGDDNLAYVFFADGVRELAFQQGLTREESDRFLAIGAEGFGAPGMQVDVANRLWEAGLAHIKHFTVDRIVDGAYIDAADDRKLSDRVHSFVGREAKSVEGTDDTKTDAGEAAGAPEGPYAGVQLERYAHIMKVFGDISSLSVAEKADVAALCHADSDQASEELGLGLLLEIIRTSESRRMIDESVAVLERQFEQSVERDRWDLTRVLLMHWQEAAAQAPTAVAQRLSAALPRVADKRHFERLSAHLNANPQLDLEPIGALLALFGASAITPITAMLGTLEHRPARMMVCDFLAKHGRDTVDLIGGFIYDKRWFVARNVAMILGEIGHERGLSFLRKSATHADPRVRLETLRAVQRMQVPEAERILRGFLKDSDGDLRRRALRALGQRHGATALAELKAQIDPAALPDKDPQERRELLTTYARLGEAEAVETLIRLARRSPFFGRARWRPVRQAAVWALGAATDVRARGELEILARGRNRELAQAARGALARRLQGEDEADADASSREDGRP